MGKHTLGQKLCSRWFKIYWEAAQKSSLKISNISQSPPRGVLDVFLPELSYFNIWFSCLHQKCMSFLPECAKKKKAFKSIYWYLRQEYNSLLPQCLEGGLEQTMTWRVMAVMTRVCLRIQTESHSDHRSGFVSSLCVFPFKKVLRHHGIVWWWTCSF